MKLSELINKYYSVSIIGMSKNAGKTTVLNKLIGELSERKMILGITSVGRDGESTDVLTITPKPEIFVPKGTLAATAKKLLPFCTATVEILYCTGIPTPLGEIIIIRTLSSGYIQIAGPSIIEQLKIVNELFKKYGANKILIDGALSRRSLCSTAVSDATILSSGASYSLDIDETVADTAFAVKMLSLPVQKGVFVKSGKTYVFYYADGQKTESDDADEIIKTKPETVYVNGGLTDGIIKTFITKNIDIEGVVFVVNDSSAIFLTEKYYKTLTQRGAILRVLSDVNLVAVTVNPVSAYGYLYNAEDYIAKMKNLVAIPVFNVEKDYE